MRQALFCEWKEALKLDGPAYGIEKAQGYLLEQVHASSDDYASLVAHAACTLQGRKTGVLTVEEVEQFADKVQEAKDAELRQFRETGAVEEAPAASAQKGLVSMRWVLTWRTMEKEEGDKRDQKVKARLVARGFEDPDKRDNSLMVNCSMAFREIHMVVLSTSATMGWSVHKADVKAAFLKSDKLKRSVYCLPPKEARVATGMVWKCCKAIYGLADGPSEFIASVRRYFGASEEWMAHAGLQVTEPSYDCCLFLVRNMAGELVGLVSSHVDDFLIGMASEWLQVFIAMVEERYGPMVVEATPFMHCGVWIQADPSIKGYTADQQYYVDRIEAVGIPDEKEWSEDLLEQKVAEVLKVNGQIASIAYTTRPDLACQSGEVAMSINTLCSRDLEAVNKMVRDAHRFKSIAILRFPGGMDECAGCIGGRGGRGKRRELVG